MPGPADVRGSDAAAPHPPVARVEPHTRLHLGRTLTDPYAWLQDVEDPEVLAYLKAENEYARAVLRPTKGLQEQLVREMRSRIADEDCSALQCVE